MANSVVVKMLLLVWLSSMMACSKSACSDTTCDDYLYQNDAQADYDSDPECYANLDSDNDGEACEHLPSSTSSGCPATANCGCSNKKKDECASNCCKWVVGEGCKCK